MNYTKCPKCKEYHWDTGSCKPSFFVVNEDGFYDYLRSGYDPTIIYAMDEESAAIAYCGSDWENPETMEVYVISTKTYYDIVDESLDEDAEDDKITKASKHYRIGSELVRNYYLEEEL